jgi:cell wall-associated NlpC family hydrolase
MQVIGLPYVWGGNSLQNGVDCSGLVQQIYGQLGVSLPRTAHDQSHSTMGTRAAINQLQPGDLVAWQGGWRGPNYVGHIAIYAGNGEIIEAPSAGQTVRRRNLRSDENVFGYHLSLPGD